MHHCNIMVVQGASKRRLDTLPRCPQPSAVKRLGWTLLAAQLAAAPLRAQAPDLTLLWRVSGGVLTTPAPLQSGPIGVFWNPAAVQSVPGLALGLEVMHTPDVVSMSSLLAGVTYQVGRHLGVGVSAGRVSIGDLVRTSTSPGSDEGDIPVYAQFVGVAAGTTVGPLGVGAEVRLHDVRLDADGNHGLTADVGFHLRPIAGLTIAAASQFATLDLAGRATAAYSAAAEYRLAAGHALGGRAAVLGRYGIELRGNGDVEHVLSTGLALRDLLRVDVALLRAEGYGTAAWQPVVGVELRAGRYLVGVARGSGLNGVGATYRIDLNAGVLP
jgi:hypothetical protein